MQSTHHFLSDQPLDLLERLELHINNEWPGKFAITLEESRDVMVFLFGAFSSGKATNSKEFLVSHMELRSLLAGKLLFKYGLDPEITKSFLLRMPLPQTVFYSSNFKPLKPHVHPNPLIVSQIEDELIPPYKYATRSQIAKQFNLIISFLYNTPYRFKANNN